MEARFMEESYIPILLLPQSLRKWHNLFLRQGLLLHQPTRGCTTITTPKISKNSCPLPEKSPNSFLHHHPSSFSPSFSSFSPSAGVSTIPYSVRASRIMIYCPALCSQSHCLSYASCITSPLEGGVIQPSPYYRDLQVHSWKPLGV